MWIESVDVFPNTPYANSPDVRTQHSVIIVVSCTAITPLVTNEVGLYTDTKYSPRHKLPPAAILTARTTTLHKLSKEAVDADMKLALPNDMCHSIRPGDRKYR